jgi:oxygen-independent coproporphyrinogen-3 oxidase
MYCILQGHSHIYEIQTITQIFYPNERFIQVEAVAPEGVTALSRLTETECRAELYVDGELAQTRVMPREGELPESGTARPVPVFGPVGSDQETRRRLMICLFLACQAQTGLKTAWGALTGIRPSKMARLMLEQGLSREQILNAMEQNYFTSRDKMNLAVDVALAEKQIVSSQPEDAFSLYVGIPFCPTRCLYCSFASYPIGKDYSRADAYLAALARELAAIRTFTERKPISSIYIGGGTPTALSEAQLDILLDRIVELFGQAPEFSVEAGRPDTVNTAKLRSLKAHGVTRISLNPQTLNDETLARIGRAHTSAQFMESYALARSEGFDNINMDVILGLPGETAVDTNSTISGLLRLKPENLTVHTLTIKRASRLRETLEQYPMAEPAELERMLAGSQKLCAAAGLRPYYMYRQKNMLGNYENVGYTVPGRESLYNVLIMEETQSIWAAGAGAVTKLKSGDKLQRAFNVKSLDDYINRIDEMITRKEVRIC